MSRTWKPSLRHRILGITSMITLCAPLAPAAHAQAATRQQAATPAAPAAPVMGAVPAAYRAHAARPATAPLYTVRRGDTLSAIALKFLGSAAAWRGLYAANQAAVGADPNLLRVGTVLRLTEAPVQQAPAAQSYRVRRGDSLTSVAARRLGSAAAWEGLYAANLATVGRNPDDLKVGTVLRLTQAPLTATVLAGIHAATAPAPAPAEHSPWKDSGWHPAPAAQADASYSGGGWPGGAFGACVVERESGGNPDIWNASAHYGLYQFSYSTWVEYGGDPALFGHASVAYQEQIFMNAMNRDGEDNWAPYDGC
jgi:LysM repeat protein